MAHSATGRGRVADSRLNSCNGPWGKSKGDDGLATFARRRCHTFSPKVCVVRASARGYHQYGRQGTSFSGVGDAGQPLQSARGGQQLERYRPYRVADLPRHHDLPDDRRGRRDARGAAARYAGAAAHPAGQHPAQAVLPVRAHRAGAVPPRHPGAARAARPQDARVRSRHPLSWRRATGARTRCASSCTTSSSCRPSPARSARR